MKTVKLYDGREVSSASEEFRHECEARHLLTFPPNYRRGYLDKIKTKRGPEAARLMGDMVYHLWIDKQVRALMKMDCDRERIVWLTRIERAANLRTREAVEKVLNGRLSANYNERES